jgi:hypothetical protein
MVKRLAAACLRVFLFLMAMSFKAEGCGPSSEDCEDYCMMAPISNAGYNDCVEQCLAEAGR